MRPKNKKLSQNSKSKAPLTPSKVRHLTFACPKCKAKLRLGFNWKKTVERQPDDNTGKNTSG